MAIKNPPHPGDFIRTEIVEAAGLTVTAAARALRVSRPALSSLLNGKADLSGEMALRIEKAFGVRMDTLMRMQSAYDIAQTRKRAGSFHIPRLPVANSSSLSADYGGIRVGIPGEHIPRVAFSSRKGHL